MAFQLKIIIPERIVYEGSVTSVVLPTLNSRKFILRERFAEEIRKVVNLQGALGTEPRRTMTLTGFGKDNID